MIAALGIADAPSVWTSDRGWTYGFLKFAETPEFQLLQRKVPLGYARFFCPWDISLETQTPVPPSARLKLEVELARKVGLQPLVCLAQGVGSIKNPVLPRDYAVLHQSFTQLLRWFPDVHMWEAYNEPDGCKEYNGGDSPQLAAQIWLCLNDAAKQIGRHDLISAGVTAGPSVPWYDTYVKALHHAGAAPPRWSFHDYGDVADGTTTQAAKFIHHVNADFSRHGKPAPYYWISETGLELHNGSAGSPDRSRGAAHTLKELAKLPRVRQVYWFHYQVANASTGWDSALFSGPEEPHGVWAYRSPNGRYGEPRQVYGALTGAPASEDPIDHTPWSCQQAHGPWPDGSA